MLTILTVFIVGLFCSYWWLSTKWKDFYTEEEMKEMANLINETPALTDNFYLAYDDLYPGHKDQALGEMSISIVWQILTNQDKSEISRQCNCISSTQRFANKVPSSYHSWTRYITAHGLENFTTEGKCLDFNYHQLDMEKYANQYFNKSFKLLTYEENLELIIRLNNPILYDKLNEKIKDLTNKETS